jgi:N-acetylglucosamine-6-phosphate deacetylase
LIPALALNIPCRNTLPKVRLALICALVADGTLAGSLLTMDAAVRNSVNLAEATLVEACRMASEVPARVMGQNTKGRLAPGCDADLVLLDDDLHVLSTYVGGRLAFDAKAPGPGLRIAT